MLERKDVARARPARTKAVLGVTRNSLGRQKMDERLADQFFETSHHHRRKRDWTIVLDAVGLAFFVHRDYIGSSPVKGEAASGKTGVEQINQGSC